MTETVRSQMQASDIRFLRKIKRVTMFAIRESLDIERLLLRIERFQLRWFGHVSKMPHEQLPKPALHAEVSGKKPVGRPQTRSLDYIDDLGWNRLRPHLSEMQLVLVD